MDFFTNQESLLILLTQYGSILLFFLLLLGIVGLPIPDETLMILAGVLMSQGDLPIASTLIAAYAGSLCGITLSYILGKTAGAYLLHKYQTWIGITEEHLELVRRYGKWALFFGYFIPGVRHISGLSFGIAEGSYKQFALFAYSGAFLWTSLCLSIGYFFSPYAIALVESIELTLTQFLLLLGTFVLIYFLYLFLKPKNQ
jgi:membrane protein DedA with SNARE-associated domain